MEVITPQKQMLQIVYQVGLEHIDDFIDMFSDLVHEQTHTIIA